MGSRIVLTTFGSLGDLHPYLAIALELKRRGHQPVVASIEPHRERVVAAGLEFRLLRTALVDTPDRELMRKILDPRRGPEFIIRSLLMPALRTAYDDTIAAAEGAALLVSHPLTFSTRLVAEQQDIPWVSTQLAPCGLFSAYDPPALPAPFFSRLRSLGPAFFRPIFSLARRSVRSWTEPYRQLRAELGLPAIADPMFAGNFSPLLTLCLFSDLIGRKQPDWPENAVITSFPFYDHDVGVSGVRNGISPELDDFLHRGPAPIVFTLGTSAVVDPGRFYHDSIAAAQVLGRRAVLLTGKDGLEQFSKLPDGVAAFDYAPFSELFPRASAIIHQGGIGTTAQAMRSGRPMLVMPCAVDQPDNADRVCRLGIARVIRRRSYSPHRTAAEIKLLLEDPGYATNAASVAAQLAQEDGAVAACDRLEALLR